MLSGKEPGHRGGSEHPAGEIVPGDEEQKGGCGVQAGLAPGPQG